MALGEPRLGPSGVVERRAAVAPRAFALPSLLSVDETRRLLACTLDFARGPDSVDREPTFECFVFEHLYFYFLYKLLEYFFSYFLKLF